MSSKNDTGRADFEAWSGKVGTVLAPSPSGLIRVHMDPAYVPAALKAKRDELLLPKYIGMTVVSHQTPALNWNWQVLEALDDTTWNPSKETFPTKK